MAPDLQYHESKEKVCYDKDFPYEELGVIFNTGPIISRNVIIYGIGDKTEILENLMENQLSTIQSTYFDGSSIRFGTRQLLDTITEECHLSITYTKNDFLEYSNMIKKEVEKKKENFSLAILIDNCDYDELVCNSTLQNCLSIICSTKKVFFIGTCIHPIFPAPGTDAREELRCYFLKFSTFKYSVKDNDDDVMEVDDDGVAHKIQSVKVVYDSLTPNTKQLFILMMRQFAKNNYKSIFSDELYIQAKNKFIIGNSSISVMHQMITEFLDHYLIEKLHDNTGRVKFSLRIKKKVLNDFMESVGLTMDDEDDDGDDDGDDDEED